MTKFVKFPSINQFAAIIKHVHSAANYHQVPVPTLKFNGTVKLHGTNAGLTVDRSGKWIVQSREREITPESDNAGFATWCRGNQAVWDEVFHELMPLIAEDEQLVIFGEWCGSNIQKGVGLNHLPKMFVIFACGVVKFVQQPTDVSGKFVEHAEVTWLNTASIGGPVKRMFENSGVGVFFSMEFKTYEIDIDFTDPKAVQNKLVELTIEVENDCPVARSFIDDPTITLIGEGIVWEVDLANSVYDPVLENSLIGLRMKTKGEKHSSSKVKVIVPVDEQKVASVNEFVEYACTTNRLEQGLSKLTEMGLDHSPANTGAFIKWVMGDIVKEELETLVASNLTMKDVNGPIANKARKFFMEVQ